MTLPAHPAWLAPLLLAALPAAAAAAGASSGAGAGEEFARALQDDDACSGAADTVVCSLSALQRGTGTSAGSGGLAAGERRGAGWTSTKHCLNTILGKCVEESSFDFLQSRLEQACQHDGLDPILGCSLDPCEYSGIRDGGCAEQGYNCTREWSRAPVDQLSKYTLFYGMTWYQRPNSTGSCP
mmetsp:Transcript_39865/g.124222  ORF Transcript_39865/g.124222 Transcript_39865/m.124222 type:complete len:183 (+) Transcript_39865:75-623(+)